MNKLIGNVNIMTYEESLDLIPKDAHINYKGHKFKFKDIVLVVNRSEKYNFKKFDVYKLNNDNFSEQAIINLI